MFAQNIIIRQRREIKFHTQLCTYGLSLAVMRKARESHDNSGESGTVGKKLS